MFAAISFLNARVEPADLSFDSNFLLVNKHITVFCIGIVLKKPLAVKRILVCEQCPRPCRPRRLRRQDLWLSLVNDTRRSRRAIKVVDRLWIRDIIDSILATATRLLSLIVSRNRS